MNVGKAIKALKKYDGQLPVYIRKNEFFGNVGYVFYTSKVKHPILGFDCVVLRDDTPYEVYDQEDEDEKAYMGKCADCPNYEECDGCEECEHVANRVTSTIHDGGCSVEKSLMTVNSLIKTLETVDQKADIMTKPRNGQKNFCDVIGIRVESYSFFGSEIPCVYVTAI